MAYTTRTIEARGIWQGEDVSWLFQTDTDMTGGSVSWKLTSDEGEGTVLLSKSGVIGIDGTEFTVTLTDVETDAIEPGIYWHEAKFTASGGLISQIIAPSQVVIYRSAI